MKKVLMINTVEFEQNGITSVCINLCNNINEERFQIDLISINEIDQALKSKFNEFPNFIILPNRKKYLFSYLKALNKTIRDGNYDIVHIHGNSATMAFECIISIIHGIKKIIAHCHSNMTSHKIFNRVVKPIFKMTYSCAIACSDVAGDWLFGKGKFITLKNGIDVESLRFNNENRERLRKSLGLTNEFVIGHIGLFNESKNHEYLLLVLRALKDKGGNNKLLLLGHGELKETVRLKAEELDLNKDIIYLENRNDISSLLSAMDIFLFPSKWEGFGLALLEAQANGLPCAASNFVNKEVNVTNTLTYIDLNDLEKWISFILNFEIQDRNSASAMNIKKISEKGYDSKSIALDLEKIYG